MAFKFVTSWSREGISNVVETNLRYWLIDSFTRIGAYSQNQTVELQPDASGSYGSEFRWVSPIKNWAWQIIDDYGDVVRSPAIISVNDIVTTNTIIDYLRGEVMLNTVLGPTDKVTASFVSSNISIVASIELPRRPLVTLDPTTKDSDNYQTVFEQIAAKYKVQTPYILVSVFPTGSARPYCIGTGRVWTEMSIQMNLMTETEYELNKLLGILKTQSFQTIHLFDSNRASVDGALPLDRNGDINTGENALLYEGLLAKYRIDSMYWDRLSVRKFHSNRQDVFMGLAWLTISVLSNPNL